MGIYIYQKVFKIFNDLISLSNSDMFLYWFNFAHEIIINISGLLILKY